MGMTNSAATLTQPTKETLNSQIRKLVRTPQSHVFNIVVDSFWIISAPPAICMIAHRKIIMQTASTSTGPDRLACSGSEPTPLTLTQHICRWLKIKCSDGLARRKCLAENMTSRRVLVLKALLNMADDCTRLVRRPGQPDQSLIAKLSAGSDPRKGSCRFVGFVDRVSP
ncbi:uncharacterized protein PGTG_11454 [Puccinia graminis f. sp. tritici CRL 75-36-700-3]|uniref:Uncharacterized protein n=1 Tax=Puccinia graminis f. sp. tritici (strain CRL 75-36-700-3 / race SCCL) TaxID=418459 RepID=E3KLT6_PUCGT|nr:uncharacterized protein PGTG_11454 [Puccinia graminis f. sp. tritici CRL 75-36-700-3]EFP85285.2 hypothetical protein PGTG_11454 [Puccinia graminis f. sp. tritici CRL 75-36-700-3]